jgi:hypothetical protein
MSDAQYQTALGLFAQGRYPEGNRVLSQAALAGHAPSMTLLGAHLMSGKGGEGDLATGALLTVRAAGLGGAEACARAAILCARGFSGQPDWPRALDYLQRSAELGFQPARDQLRLLSGFRAGIDWKKLRRAVDMAAWRKLPATQTLSDAPLIQIAPGLIRADICDAIVARARPLMAPAPVYDETRGGNTLDGARTNSGALLTILDIDLVTEAVRYRMCALAGMPAVHAEYPWVLHYKPGESFAAHFDFWDPAFEGYAATLEQYGQRAFTVLVYLNDDGLEGGETDFPELGLRHRGRKGDAIVFRNVDEQGQPDRRTLHAGLPPTRGEKWLLSLWIHDRPAPEIGNPGLMSAMANR